MARTILMTGGAASGKSRWAVSQFAACDNVLYICPGILDDDIRHRIEFSNKKNYVEWDIRENIKHDPKDLIDRHKFVVFDGLKEYTDVVVEDICPDVADMTTSLQKEIEKKIVDDVLAMHDEIRLIEGDIVIITLETGFSMESDDPMQRAKRKILGIVNQRIANNSSDVYLSASGIQFKIK